MAIRSNILNFYARTHLCEVKRKLGKFWKRALARRSYYATPCDCATDPAGGEATGDGVQPFTLCRKI